MTKNYNMFALGGDTDTSDMDVCVSLGLDIQLAHTPAINDAAIEAMRQQNIAAFIRSGMNPQDAQAQASYEADKALARVKAALIDEERTPYG
jgi:hypothetical protein